VEEPFLQATECKKVKVPLTGPKTERGDRGIALILLDLGARRGWW
jgi:hypothetical protein